MLFTFNCPHCNVKIEAKDEWRGVEAECPSCGNKLIIPVNLQQTSE